jgi:hypothetical protein
MIRAAHGRCVMLLATATIAANAGGQMPNQPRMSEEYRADVLFGRGTAGQVGAGVQLPLGYYVRLGVTGAAGVTWRDGDSVGGGRVDIVARYLLDPFREVAWTPSFGGGLTVRYDDGDERPHAYLAVVLDVEGPRLRRALSPAFQIGLGGGTRLGFVLRTTRGPWR